MMRNLIAATLLVLTAATAKGVTISGTIVDPATQNWSPVAGATVVAVHPATGQEFTTNTDGLGKYTLRGLPPDTEMNLKFRKQNHLRDPQSRSVKTTSGNVVVDEYLIRDTEGLDYFRRFALRLAESQSAADAERAESLFHIYTALPKNIRKTVDAELDGRNITLQRKAKD